MNSRSAITAGMVKTDFIRQGRVRFHALQVLLISAAIVTPCFWQKHIQAGDLSSHIYNAWLAQLIEAGKIHGLTITWQWTNVLFDLILSGLLRAVGAEWAQRIAVSVAVLVFVWGAFALTGAICRRWPWFLLPCLAMLAYGWVFRMGLFNFYLALGLVFWSLALLWNGSLRARIVAVPLLGLAFAAHALPVVAGVCLYGYAEIARRIRPRRRVYLALTAIAALVLLRVFLMAHFPYRWFPMQILAAFGVDQFWVFGGKYGIVLLGALFLWGWWFVRVLHARGVFRTLSGIPFQLCLVAAAGIALLPSAVQLPLYHASLAYIAERMSLVIAVLLCALMGTVRTTRWENAVSAALALTFFVFLYSDSSVLNRLEDRVDAVVSQLPRGERVVNGLSASYTRVNPLAHVVDRACIGRCFSYANYEASTAAFRIRVKPDNGVVVASYRDSFALQSGTYVVKRKDLPLYQVTVCRGNSGEVCLRPLEAGTVCTTTQLLVMPGLLNFKG